MYSLARGRAALLAVCLIFAVHLPTFGQEPAGGSALVPVARALKVAQAPSLDGRVAGDPAWEAVPPLTDFWQTAPDAGQPASERTEVRIAYTEDALYVGVTLYDRSSEGLTLSDSRRDSPLDDVDSFRILLDTYKDRQNGFVFATNPAALEYDGQVIGEGGMNLGGGGGGGGRQQAGSGGGFNLNWDGAWRVRTAMTDDGWSAEFEIPFRTLRYEPGTAREWGLNFQRTIRRRKESAYWAPLPFQFDLLKVSQAGTLAGLDLPAQRNLKLIPYALGEVRERGVATSRTTTLGDIGLDAKYSLTPSLTLDATVNTDFAQVEVDEQQVNLDRFNLFFPEKRPFFLENAGLFAVGASGEAEVFFSRRIGIAANGEEIPIIAGGRLSGKAGPVNVGLLNMQTEDTVGTPMNNFTVARVRRDFANRSNLGAIFVGRLATGGTALPDDHNASFAVDGRWGIGRTGLISGFAARSATPGVSSDQHAYQIGARNETQPLTLNVALTETGRNFNPEVGFLSRRGGFRKFEALAFSRLRPKSLSTFQEIRPHAIYRGYWNPSGFLETGFLHMDSHWELKNSWEFHTGVNVTREGVVVPFDIVPGVPVPAGVYENAETQLVLQSNQGASVYGRMQVTKGGFFNGNRVAYNPQLRVRMGETLNVEMSLERNDVDLQTGSFITNLARMRASYSFSPRLFVQSLIQYNDRADAWTSNFRFGWLQQANTGLFLVYTDSHDLDERALVPPTGTNRSLTLKISRMFDALN
ncbi:MAG TPA: DUF5916 domain-containing protein [Vicinamibacterales bacterium]|nr:DUF5916 domain-containing protein [Vicinamibacterales bacterium]